jgi:hypothetical protein
VQLLLALLQVLRVHAASQIEMCCEHSSFVYMHDSLSHSILVV